MGATDHSWPTCISVRQFLWQHISKNLFSFIAGSIQHFQKPLPIKVWTRKQSNNKENVSPLFFCLTHAIVICTWAGGRHTWSCCCCSRSALDVMMRSDSESWRRFYLVLFCNVPLPVALRVCVCVFVCVETSLNISVVVKFVSLQAVCVFSITDKLIQYLEHQSLLSGPVFTATPHVEVNSHGGVTLYSMWVITEEWVSHESGRTWC